MSETPFFETRARFIASVDAAVSDALLEIAKGSEFDFDRLIDRSRLLDPIVRRLADSAIAALDDSDVREALQFIRLDSELSSPGHPMTLREIVTGNLFRELVRSGLEHLQQRMVSFEPAEETTLALQVVVRSGQWKGRTLGEIKNRPGAPLWLKRMLTEGQPRRDPNHAEHDVFLAAESIAATHFPELLPRNRGDR
jgi:hypothetical protein